MAKAKDVDFEMGLMVREMATQRIVEDRMVEWKAPGRPGTPAFFDKMDYVLMDFKQIEKHREESSSVPNGYFKHRSFNSS